MQITVGWTEQSLDGNYIPSFDGWRAEAQQDTVVIDLPSEFDTTVSEIGEAVFEATNSPYRAVRPLVRWLQDEFNRISATRAFRSLSVGDTVTKGSEIAEVVSMGFKVHTIGR